LNFTGLQAKYRRIFDESRVWKLLRADNAPIILSFLASIFAEESEVPFSRARIDLDAELIRLRELGVWETDTSAGVYLNLWIKAGWLREMDDMLSKTEAAEIALRFCKSLDEKANVTTASHLRIVQEAVRELLVAISTNPEERLVLLEEKKAAIQHEIDQLHAGVIVELSAAEQAERIREIYQLASVLPGDFRRVEDEIRMLDQSLRVQIIEADTTRGDVLQSVMQQETVLENTDAGRAFEGFFQLLCEQNRSMEFRDQLRTVLNQPAADHLTPPQKHFLSQLMRELTRESDRVFKIRRRTEEGLRNYIESGWARENLAVDRLLSRLERRAVALRERSLNPRCLTRLSLPVGPVQINSPEKMRLRTPDEKLDTSGIREKKNSGTPSFEMLNILDTVRIRHVAEKARAALARHGPMTIGEIAAIHPLTAGLEELVAFLRVAKAVGAASIDRQEKIELRDKQGHFMRASIPCFLLSAELFPENSDNLNI
jgi:hypothetical protein